MEGTCPTNYQMPFEKYSPYERTFDRSFDRTFDRSFDRPFDRNFDRSFERGYPMMPYGNNFYNRGNGYEMNPWFNRYESYPWSTRYESFPWVNRDECFRREMAPWFNRHEMSHPWYNNFFGNDWFKNFGNWFGDSVDKSYKTIEHELDHLRKFFNKTFEGMKGDYSSALTQTASRPTSNLEYYTFMVCSY